MLKHFADLANEYPDNDNKPRFFPILNESSIAPYGYPRFVAINSTFTESAIFFMTLYTTKKSGKKLNIGFYFSTLPVLIRHFLYPSFTEFFLYG